MNKPIQLNSKIFVAGHKGMVGSAIVRLLKQKGYSNILTKTKDQLDLTSQNQVNAFFQEEQPDYVFLAAAKVGGIVANNTFRADFIYQNLLIEANIIHAANQIDLNRLLFLGSSCIYPRECPQPIKEEYLLTGPLEPTNEPYAIAKIAGIKLCESYNLQYNRDYVCVMPTNLYGPNDNYDLNNSHVLPALIRKAHEAKMRGDNQLVIWGSGKPLREFLYVDDLAQGCVFLMESDIKRGLYNLGVGKDISIAQLAELVKEVIGFEGSLVFDTSKPDGTPRKLLNIDKIKALGWQPTTALKEGIAKSYQDYLKKSQSINSPVMV